MSTRTEIVEAGARAIHEDQCSSPDEVCNPDCFRVKELSEVALDAMLPLILEALAGKVRTQKRGINDWNDDVREQVAQLIERFEL